METIDAIIDHLRLVDATPDHPVSIMYEVGIPMIGAGHSQDQVLNALFYLEAKKQIELLPGNRLRVVMPL